MALSEQIEQFQSTMNKVTELIEEATALAGQIPSASIEEAPAKMQEIFELCSDGMNSLNQGIGEAEEIQATIG